VFAIRAARPREETAFDSFYLTILDAEGSLLDQGSNPVWILGTGWKPVKKRECKAATGKVSRFQGFKVSGFQGFKVSKVSGFGENASNLPPINIVFMIETLKL